MDFQRSKLLYKLVAHNQRLQDRRHPMFEKNRVMKILGYLFVAFWAAYLLMFGFTLPFAFQSSSIEAFDIIDGILVFFLALDFITRFGMQETPAQNIKQYKLLNVPTKLLLHTFLCRMGLQLYNFFWAFFFVPFGSLAVYKFYGFIGLAGFLFGWWLMYVLNSYWYLLWRTFINRKFWTIVIPFAIYAVVIYLGYFHDEHDRWLFQLSAKLIRGFIEWNPLCWLFFIITVTVLYAVNYRLQKVAVYTEISKTDQSLNVKTNNMTFLDKFGVIGEYLKLEIKSTLRNLVVRKQFVSGMLLMLMFCCMFAFSDIYDNKPFMQVFVCIYCFSCLGVMTLTSVMCAEGNYIDGLMVRKETILSLLKAKYYFHCIMLIVPMLFSLMPMLQGKVTFMTLLGCMLFVSGAVFPFIFQLAVYNETSIHLNAKLTKAGRDTKSQLIMSALALFVPMFVMYAFVTLFGDGTASVVMVTIGGIGTLLHPLWLRNIYWRFMDRRYKNMDGFRNSRGDS